MAEVYISNSLKARLGLYFGAHGRFCARHPWEVIVSVVTLTVSCLSIGVLSGGRVGTICGINKPCHEKGEVTFDWDLEIQLRSDFSSALSLIGL